MILICFCGLIKISTNNCTDLNRTKEKIINIKKKAVQELFKSILNTIHNELPRVSASG